MLPFRLMTDCLVLIGVPEHLIQAALTYKPNHAAMEALLARCIKIRKKHPKYQFETVIELIFLSGDWDWVQRLLLTTSINARDLQNNNLAHFAVRSENEDIIQNISLKFPSLLNEKNAKGQTPMNFDFTSESSYEDETESSGYSYLNVLESSYEDETESYEYESDENISLKDKIDLIQEKARLLVRTHEEIENRPLPFSINSLKDLKKLRSDCIELLSDIENLSQNNAASSSLVAKLTKITKQFQKLDSNLRDLIDKMTVTIPEAICCDDDSHCVPQMR